MQTTLWHQRSHTRAFLWTMAIFWAIGCLILAWKGYNDSFLLLNRFRSGLADTVMPHLTHFGEGFFISGLMGLTLVRRASWLWLMAATMVVVLGTIILCKFVIFADWDRPLSVFEEGEFFYVALKPLRKNAFPSGHSAAVAGAVALAVFGQNERPAWIGVFASIGLILVAYTRLYIGVHFLGDVVVGTMVGVGIAALWAATLGTKVEKWWDKQDPAQQRRLTQVGTGFVLLVMCYGIYSLGTRYYF
ncbi:MAG: phosphatase PAP2 family protein [Bacteroidota bacterium]